jgi:hypothetical protein
VRDRLEREDLTVLAYRFAGDHFVGRVLPDSAANSDVAPFFAVRVACLTVW